MWIRGKVPSALKISAFSTLISLWNVKGLDVDGVWKTFFFPHNFFTKKSFPVVMPRLSKACPHSYSHYAGLIFFFIILIVLESVSSVESSEIIFSIPCLIVE